MAERGEVGGEDERAGRVGGDADAAGYDEEVDVCAGGEEGLEPDFGEDGCGPARETGF